MRRTHKYVDWYIIWHHQMLGQGGFGEIALPRRLYGRLTYLVLRRIWHAYVQGRPVDEMLSRTLYGLWSPLPHDAPSLERLAVGALVGPRRGHGPKTCG